MGKQKAKQTDYSIFTDFARELGCEYQGIVGYLPNAKKVRVETWAFPEGKSGGFLLFINQSNGTIGIYGLVGQPGAPLIRGIEWLKERCS